MVAAITALVAMLVFGGAVSIALHCLLRPLRRASEAAVQIEPGNLTTRLMVDGMPTEFIPLLSAFNLALGRVEQGYQVQREFLATAAHELKTPNTLMRGEIELEGTADRGVLLRDLDHMGRQVYQLLHLAEVSERRNFSIEEVNPAVVVQEAVENLERLARQYNVYLQYSLAERLPKLIQADESALFVSVRNLIENAIHHAPAGSGIDVIAHETYVSVT